MGSLYRHHRPKKFAEVIGQDHIKTVLLNSIKRGQVAHAYLFSGSRGTGKTTMARLFAKAINCLEHKDGEACDSCQICQLFDRDQMFDVLEIDAASNRGIDEARELRDKVNYPPAHGRFRVYIIDEAHMLTKEAANALLKTLEEPPSHSVFILATTEYHKLPDTIISRCERHHFHRATNSSISDLVKLVAKKEKIDLSADAIDLLVRRAEGSFRDVLTLLGNLNLSTQEKISAEKIRKEFGLPKLEVVTNLYQKIIDGDKLEVIKIFEESRSLGEDPLILVKNLIEHLEEIIISQPSAPKVNINSQILEELLIGLVRAKSLNEPFGLFLAILIRLTEKNQTKTANAINESFSQPPSTTHVVDVQKVVKNISEENRVDTLHQTVQSDQQKSFWEQFLNEIKAQNHALYMIVRSASLGGIEGGKLTILVKFKFYADRLNELKNRKIVESCASKLVGSTVILDCQVKIDLEVVTPVDETFEAVVEVFELEG